MLLDGEARATSANRLGATEVQLHEGWPVHQDMSHGSFFAQELLQRTTQQCLSKQWESMIRGQKPNPKLVYQSCSKCAADAHLLSARGASGQKGPGWRQGPCRPLPRAQPLRSNRHFETPFCLITSFPFRFRSGIPCLLRRLSGSGQNKRKGFDHH